MWLSWTWALGITAALGGVGVGLRARPERRLHPALRGLTDELTLMFFLYTLWRICGRLSVMGVENALDRGRDVWRLQRLLRFPSELVLQEWVLPHGWLVQAANIYYAVAHAPALGIMLVWLFFWKRSHYRHIRTTLVISTFACLLIQLVPVGPPRLLPELGFVDTARVYGQSVYGTALGPESFNQLSAMPSVHVAWAVLVGWYAWRISASRWRWVAVVHAVLTVWVVTVTANHWLLDGVVAVLLLIAADRLTSLVWPTERGTMSPTTEEARWLSASTTTSSPTSRTTPTSTGSITRARP